MLRAEEGMYSLKIEPLRGDNMNLRAHSQTLPKCSFNRQTTLRSAAPASSWRHESQHRHQYNTKYRRRKAHLNCRMCLILSSLSHSPPFVAHSRHSRPDTSTNYFTFIPFASPHNTFWS